MYQISLKRRPFPEHWRALAEYWEISSSAKQRLEWMIFYYSVGKRNAATYFGISRKTFHKWKKRFNPHLIQSLEEQSRIPHKKRAWEVTREEEANIIALRKRHLKWGKKKLQVRYQKEYGKRISTWKIERVIRKHRLYPDLQAHAKQVQKRQKAKLKVRINQLKKKDKFGFLWHIDAIIIWWYGVRRVIFTALEELTKIAYARVYSTNSSGYAEDFLKRLMYLVEGKVEIIHSDNGSEFEGAFKKACQKLGIEQVYSRPKTPKDNPALERFNWTIQDEWLSLSEVGLDEVDKANQDLARWLVEYNSERPHEALDYLTPLEYTQKNFFQVLPMWSARTV